MKANEMNRDELAAFLGTDAGGAFMGGIDAKWGEAIEPMRRAGFIAQACGGTAIMCTYSNMMESQGVDGVVRMLQTNGVEVPDIGIDIKDD